MAENFSEKEIFRYNKTHKRLIGIITLLGWAIAITLVTMLLFLVNSPESATGQVMRDIINHIFTNISKPTFLGIAYTALIGGLFFVFLPMEVLFIRFISQDYNSFAVLITYLLGFFISYSLNYLIGLRFSHPAKGIITPKKFYNIKNIVNKYGSPAVFVFNALPLPSQPLSVVLGVFKYNKAKFYFYFLLGQGIKYILIIAAFGLFKW